jgi:peptidoglycan/xylan/chitin deacetylase (PgdA/CDA1 family)
MLNLREMVNNLERDFVGYGNNPPKGTWPGGARLAVQIVVNFEEGAEMSIDKGDEMPESYGDFPPINVAQRDLGLESVFEYGSRVGIWRLLDIFDKEEIKTTFFACGEALEKNIQAAKEIVKRGHEICSHGYRWYDHFRMTEEQSRNDVRKAVVAIQKITGQRPVGWYCREPGMFIRKILVEEGGFIYDSDVYNDDVPYYVKVEGKNHLVVPYTPDCNDFHYWMGKFPNAEGFLNYLKDTFDVLYEESEKGLKMMSIGLHCRISGRPGRALAISKFVEYVKSFPDVWFATRREIAEYWLEHYPNSE